MRSLIQGQDRLHQGGDRSQPGGGENCILREKQERRQDSKKSVL